MSIVPSERAKLIAHVASRLIAAAHYDLLLDKSRDREREEIEEQCIERAVRIVERVERRCGEVSDSK